jgi:hypothetical protein
MDALSLITKAAILKADLSRYGTLMSRLTEFVGVNHDLLQDFKNNWPIVPDAPSFSDVIRSSLPQSLRDSSDIVINVNGEYEFLLVYALPAAIIYDYVDSVDEYKYPSSEGWKTCGNRRRRHQLWYATIKQECKDWIPVVRQRLVETFPDHTVIVDTTKDGIKAVILSIIPKKV